MIQPVLKNRFPQFNETGDEKNELNACRYLASMIAAGQNDLVESHLQIFADMDIVNIGRTEADHVTKKGDRFTLLHGAAVYGNTVAVNILLKHGADVNVSSAKETPLTLACFCNFTKIAIRLLESGAYVNVLNKSGITPLELAMRNDNDVLFQHLFDKKAEQLIRAALQNNADSINQLLNTPNFQSLSERELETLFIKAVDFQQFEVAKTILQHPNGLSRFNRCKSPELDRDLDEGIGPEVLAYQIEYIHFKSISHWLRKSTIKATPWNRRRNAVEDAYVKILCLLQNVDQCTELLKEIDQEIQEQCPDAAKITPGDSIIANGLKWPSKACGSCQLPKIRLRDMLCRRLAAHQVDTRDKTFTFAGFVHSKTANKIVASGALFKEQFLLGNSLIHGVYTHYFQWVIVALALDKGWITFEEELTLKDIIQSTVEIEIGNKPIWTNLIDSINHDYGLAAAGRDFSRTNAEKRRNKNDSPARYRNSSPHEMNSWLLNHPELQHLRGYLLSQWYRCILKLQKYVSEKTGKTIPYDVLVAGQAYASRVFNRFDVGLDIDDVIAYYKGKGSEINLDPKTGVATKPRSAVQSPNLSLQGIKPEGIKFNS